MWIKSWLMTLVVALTWRISHQQFADLANCNYELDVVFAIDGSNSMFRQNFETEKAAVVSLVSSLSVTPRDIHVGLVLYSSTVTASFQLSGNKQEIITNIRNLEFPDEGTRTDEAINVGHRILNGGRGGAVRKILIVITDGRSTEPERTRLEATSAKRAGVEIYAVGVTDAIKQSELTQIASNAQNVFYSQNFQTLRSVLLQATNAACVTAPPTPAPKAFRPDCNEQLDIIIAIDASNSMFETNFQREKAGIANLIRNLQVSPKGMHVGLVLFSGEVQSYPLSGNRQQVISNLNGMPYLDDATRTDLAIVRATELFRNSRGGVVQKVLIIVTDGRATYPSRALAAAQAAKSSGVNIYALGVTDAINEPELRAMASTPQQVLISNNFQTIKGDLLQLANTVCDTITTVATIPTAPTACNYQLDLVIAIDGSNSMFEKNFNIQRAAIANLISNLHVTYDDIHVGIIVFSGDVTSEVLSGNKQRVITVLNSFEYPDDTTRTDLAIQEAERIFSRARGGNVPKLLIIVTDGRATYPQRTLLSAKRAKDSGIVITCVGVTDAINQKELRAMASSPNNVIFSADFRSLERDIIQATNEACQYATTLPPVTTRTICNDHLDMVIAIDGSNSMFQANFDREKASVVNLVSNLNVSPQDIFVGLVLFSTDVTSRPLSGDKTQVIRDLNAFDYPDEATRTDLAIQEASRLLAQSRGGNVQKLLIIITDGRATYPEETQRLAESAKQSGITVYVVGVTDAINQQELRALASTPNHVFFSTSFQTLQADLMKATRRACYTISN